MPGGLEAWRLGGFFTKAIGFPLCLKSNSNFAHEAIDVLSIVVVSLLCTLKAVALQGHWNAIMPAGVAGPLQDSAETSRLPCRESEEKTIYDFLISVGRRTFKPKQGGVSGSPAD